MAILNVTPDSFSDGGKYLGHDAAIARGLELEQLGADIIDVGGESTRPGSEPIAEEEETKRVIPVIEALAPRLKIPVSIDTYRSGVARRAVEVGAQVVNDISGLRFDPQLAGVAADTGCGMVLMHSRGSRRELHLQPAVSDPIRLVVDDLRSAAETARRAGVAESAIVIDPGIGFGKDAAASFKVLKSLEVFSTLRFPILIGTSRKSFIRAVIQDAPDSRLLGTAASVALAIAGGAHVLRVHDPREMRVVADVADRVLLS